MILPMREMEWREHYLSLEGMVMDLCLSGTQRLWLLGELSRSGRAWIDSKLGFDSVECLLIELPEESGTMGVYATKYGALGRDVREAFAQIARAGVFPCQ